MKKFLLASLSTVAMASAAHAQEAPAAPEAAETVAVASPFAGPYVGVQVGVGQIDSIHDDLDDWYDGVGNGRASDRGPQFGVRVGYDFVAGNLLAGVLAEGSIGRLNAFEEASSGGDGDDDHYMIGTRTTRLGSLRGKVGLTSGRLAAFATGGLALSNGRNRFRETDGTGERFSTKADRSGYVLGLGLAYALNGNSSIGLDYSHYEFGRKTSEVLDSDGSPDGYFFEQDYKVRTLMLSWNYGFGRKSAALPVVETASFEGPYVGLQGSVAQIDTHYTDLDYWYTNTSQSRSTDRGVQIGLRAGYDWRLGGDFLAGVLAEASVGKLNNLSEHNGESPVDPMYRVGTRLSWLGSVRGKLGVASGNLAIFGTAGVAFSNAKDRFRETDGSDEFYNEKADRTGYVLGLGAAWAINGNSTLGLDYSHYEFGAGKNEIRDPDGDGTDYFIRQDYKVRALTLSFNYGF